MHVWSFSTSGALIKSSARFSLSLDDAFSSRGFRRVEAESEVAVHA